MIISMTGYGNCDCENEKISFSMELKSVNSKYYESNLKLPYIFSHQEEKINGIIQKKISRGRVSFNLSYKIKDSRFHSISLDRNKLKNYLNILNELKKDLDIDDKINLDNILNFQDILDSNQKMNDKSVIKLLYRGLDEVIKDHTSFRIKEGKNLQKDILKSINKISSSIKKIDSLCDKEKDIYKEKYQKKVNKYIDKYEIDEQRLYQEVAIIIDKRDINEELIRFKSHINCFISYVKEYNLLGKRLIFLLQELFREINTINSKSEILEINKISLEIKSELEKIKEQTYNIL